MKICIQRACEEMQRSWDCTAGAYNTQVSQGQYLCVSLEKTVFFLIFFLYIDFVAVFFLTTFPSSWNNKCKLPNWKLGRWEQRNIQVWCANWHKWSTPAAESTGSSVCRGPWHNSVDTLPSYSQHWGCAEQILRHNLCFVKTLSSVLALS